MKKSQKFIPLEISFKLKMFATYVNMWLSAKFNVLISQQKYPRMKRKIWVKSALNGMDGQLS